MRYTNDSALPEITDEMLTQSLPTSAPFTGVVLKAGPNFSMPGPDRDEGVARIIWQHGKRNFALYSAGLMPIVCPVADGSDVKGICILDATPEDAERIMSEDPGVKAKVFTFEIHPTRAFPGRALPPPGGFAADLPSKWGGVCLQVVAPDRSQVVEDAHAEGDDRGDR